MSHTRERIIKAATELFLEKGYVASGMAEILTRANANSGSFYYFFKGKDEVLSAVLDQYEENLYPVLLEPIWRVTRDPIKRVFLLLARYRELIHASKFSYGCPIGRLALEIDSSQTAIHRKVAANFDAWKVAVEQCLSEAQQHGQLSLTVDCKRLACMVLSVMEGGVMQSRSYGNAHPFDQSIEELRHYFAVLANRKSRTKSSKATKTQKRRSVWKGARRAIAFLVVVSAWTWASPPKSETKASAVEQSSYEVAGERVLRHEIVINAPLEQVWHSFTTVEGLRTWAAPVMEFELKTGGKFHSNYRPGAQIGDPGTIYNTVLSYLPQKMLSFKIGLTDQFPEGPRKAGTLLAVAQFEAVGSHKTKVALSMVGFGSGSEWDQVYKFFDTHNPTALSMLRESLVKAPIDWQKSEVSEKGAN